MDFNIHESILNPENLSFPCTLLLNAKWVDLLHTVWSISILNINSIVAAIPLVYKKLIFKIFKMYFLLLCVTLNHNFLIIRICVELYE